MALVGLGWVKVKMLPFDNKSEFQIILNMPEGSSLERTAQAAREIAAAVRVEPEVTDYQIYAGVAAPFNFNGLVRHYFMRRGRERRRHPDESRSERRAQARKATTSPNASVRASRRSPPDTMRASPSPKCRPARRCCKRSSPKSTARTNQTATPSPARCATFSRARRAWSMSIGISKPTSRRRASSSTRKRPRCTASAPRPFRRRCASPSAASRSICSTCRARKKT